MSVRISIYEPDSPCQACRATKRWLDKRRARYTTHLLTEDVRAMLTEAGYERAPGVVVTTSLGLTIDCWGGFNPPLLAQWEPQAGHVPAVLPAEDHPAGAGPAGVHDGLQEVDA
ncbi:hypothetical protein [Actinomyces faecalis]|uniref:hypothetical protein n=1 Tax=Actinomyces faecalis TaxID=2722820 RepID=UPI00155464EB|nr:hypothetical protein [Actinomyces faecalis]